MEGSRRRTAWKQKPLFSWTIPRIFHIRDKAGLPAWRSSAVKSPGDARGRKILRRHDAVPRQKTRSSMPAAEWRAKHEDGCLAAAPREACFDFFPGAGTLRKNASAN